MSMSDESFNKIMRMIAKNGMENEASALCNHEISQRETLARVEAEAGRLAEAGLAAHVKATAAQAQLAEAVGLLEPFGKMAEGKDRWPETSGVAVFPLLNQVRPVRAFLKRIDRHAQAEQQEAQGAQAGDERAAFEHFIRSRYPKTSLERIDRPGAEAHGEYESSTLHVGWIIWQARAALATQPAVRGAEQ